MRTAFTFALLFSMLLAYGQTSVPAKDTTHDARVIPVLRKQTFGEFHAFADVRTYEFDTSGLVIFNNGCLITSEEFRFVLSKAGASDTTQAVKNKMLDDLILSRQKMFEAMDQNLDTSLAFQLDFLKYKQELITPYLNEGRTRLEAESLPEVKYALRAYYCDQLLHALQKKEVWSKDTDGNLIDFWSEHPELYQGQSFAISRTKVIYDLNKKLETALNERVQSKFPYAVNPSWKRS